MKKIWFAVLLLFTIFLVSSVLAQSLSPEQIKKIKNEMKRTKKEVLRLQKKLKHTKNKKVREVILDKIDIYRAKIKKLESKLKPKLKIPTVRSRKVPEYFSITPEVVVEETPVTTEVVVSKREWRFRCEGGAVFGMFSGTTMFALETRFFLPYVLGPAVTASRFSLGYAQARDMSRGYLPLSLDLVFKYPPGWFSGVENYLGAGLNYVVFTTDKPLGTFGGQVFYGTESEGFGGIVFGEIGYGILRTGFSPSHKGVTVLVGYRKLLR